MSQAAETAPLSTARRPGQPLLSLAIPTCNRSVFLAELLEVLLPQFAGEPRAELVISDNASSDDTEAMVRGFIARGLPCRYVRNPENIGPDANFLQCLDLAQGQYAWIMGDDDLIAPRAIADLLSLMEQGEYDLVYLSSTGFGGDEKPQFERDKLGRFAEVVTDGEYFLNKVNALIGLISVNIVNKNRLMATPHPPISELNDSNLLQVGWLFPVIHRRCRILYVWERLVAYRRFNAGGWGVCEVFGLRLERIARRYFAAEPALADSLMNGVLRFWLCDSVMVMRRGQYQTMHAEDFARELRPVFGRNWRYWVFIDAIAVPPLIAALPLYRIEQAINRSYRMAQGTIRYLFSRGRQVRP